MVTKPDDYAFRSNFTELEVLLRVPHDDKLDLVVRHLRERDTEEHLLDIRLFERRPKRGSGQTKRGVMVTFGEMEDIVTAVNDSGVLERG